MLISNLCWKWVISHPSIPIKPRQLSSDDEEDIEDDDDEEEEEEEEESSADERPKKKSRRFVPPPPGREMPERTTRGKRMGTAVAAGAGQEDEADEDFWNQDFFAEEVQDEIYETESEPEDVVDADFEESEEEADSDEERQAEADARAVDKKKTLKPPGYKQAPLKPKPKLKHVDAQETTNKQARAAPTVFIPAERTVSVRQSTRQKVQEGEEERRMQETMKPRRVSRPVVHRQLTQEELLAEAANTEIENFKSLELLEAREEATKKKANVKKGRYAGPMLRIFSSQDKDSKEEKTLIEVRNMGIPPELAPRTAPPSVPKPVCSITGLPAKYKDPLTGLPYATIEAFKELRQRLSNNGLLVA